MDLKRSVSQLLCLCLACSSLPILSCFAQSPAQRPLPLPAFRGLTIRRTGGFSGIPEEWYFSDKGVRWTANGVSIQKPVDALHRLRRLVALKYRSRRNAALSVPVCSDCFIFRITVWYDDGCQTFEVAEVTAGADAEVIELLRLVRELIRTD